MKRITFILNSFSIGGIERVVISLANELSKQLDVTILVLKNKGELKKTLNTRVAVYDLGGIKVRYLLVPLIKYLRKEHPDYIISNISLISFTLIIAIFFSPLDKTRAIITHHNLFDKENKLFGLPLCVIPLLTKFFYNKAYKVIAVSDSVERILREFGIKNIVTIYNPIDRNEKIYNANNVTYKIPTSNPFFLYVGRLAEIKNIDLIISTFSIMRKKTKFKNHELIIIGDGEIREKLEQIADANPERESIHFLGALPNPEFFMVRASCVLLTSFSEAMPVTVLEALILGKLIVTTPATGCLDIFKKINYKFYSTSFNDPKEFSQVIVNAFENFDFCISYSEEVNRIYGTQIIMKHWMELLQK